MPRGSNFHRPYPPEFRREAVELYRRGGQPLIEVARDLGIATESLRTWVKQAGIDAGVRDGLSSEEREELRRLRRENRILREEREVLRKAAAFFAKESETR
jgi:transposase